MQVLGSVITLNPPRSDLSKDLQTAIIIFISALSAVLIFIGVAIFGLRVRGFWARSPSPLSRVGVSGRGGLKAKMEIPPEPDIN